MSGLGPWTIPGALEGASGITSQELATQADKLYGRDLWFDLASPDGADYVVTPAGDWKVAEGPEALRQAILRRIMTDPGEWARLPDYGVGARMYVKARNNRGTRDELTERIRSQLLRDPRIESVDEVYLEIGSDTLRIAVVVTPKGRGLAYEAVRAAIEVS